MAEEYFKKSLRVREITANIVNSETEDLYNNLGFACKEQKKYDLAKEYFDKSMQVRDTVLGIDRPDTEESYKRDSI